MGAFLQGRGENIEECVWLKGEWEGERNGFAGRSAHQLKESGNQGLRRSRARLDPAERNSGGGVVGFTRYGCLLSSCFFPKLLPDLLLFLGTFPKATLAPRTRCHFLLLFSIRLYTCQPQCQARERGDCVLPFGWALTAQHHNSKSSAMEWSSIKRVRILL